MMFSLQERLQKSKLVLVVVLIVAAIVAVAPFYEDTFSSSVVEMSDLGGLTHGGPPLETPPISIGYSKESNGNVSAASFPT